MRTESLCSLFVVTQHGRSLVTCQTINIYFWGFLSEQEIPQNIYCCVRHTHPSPLQPTWRGRHYPSCEIHLNISCHGSLTYCASFPTVFYFLHILTGYTVEFVMNVYKHTSDWPACWWRGYLSHGIRPYSIWSPDDSCGDINGSAWRVSEIREIYASTWL